MPRHSQPKQITLFMILRLTMIMIGRYGCQSPEFARLGIRKNPKEFSEESVHHFHSVHSVHHFHHSSTTSSKFHQDSTTTSASATNYLKTQKIFTTPKNILPNRNTKTQFPPEWKKVWSRLSAHIQRFFRHLERILIIFDSLALYGSLRLPLAPSGFL